MKDFHNYEKRCLPTGRDCFPNIVSRMRTASKASVSASSSCFKWYNTTARCNMGMVIELSSGPTVREMICKDYRSKRSASTKFFEREYEVARFRRCVTESG